jgi:hypothetical protein
VGTFLDKKLNDAFTCPYATYYHVFENLQTLQKYWVFVSQYVWTTELQMWGPLTRFVFIVYLLPAELYVLTISILFFPVSITVSSPSILLISSRRSFSTIFQFSYNSFSWQLTYFLHPFLWTIFYRPQLLCNLFRRFNINSKSCSPCVIRTWSSGMLHLVGYPSSIRATHFPYDYIVHCSLRTALRAAPGHCVLMVAVQFPPIARHSSGAHWWFLTQHRRKWVQWTL